ncbi:PH domain-containing protein [Nocardia inohanensis]|uniref:PH domain-containing protein n=1 Tax=Nocardia inohanensis TaxID=209246 RepID=UPI000834E629|nr:PH domain-containing protein [Nocardia inohanensis]
MTSTDSRLAWSTPPAALIACAVGGVILAGAAVITDDGAGKVLIGLAALGLLVSAGMGFRQRPRLSIEPGTPQPLVIGGVSGPQRYSAQQVLRARVVYYRRLGRKTPMLELDLNHDGDEKLIVFGRWDLGERPEEVLDTLRAHLG